MYTNYFTPIPKFNSYSANKRPQQAFGCNLDYKFADIAKNDLAKGTIYTEGKFLRIIENSKVSELYLNIMESLGNILAHKVNSLKTLDSKVKYSSCQYPMSLGKDNTSHEKKALFNFRTITRKAPSQKETPGMDKVCVDFTDEFNEIFSTLERTGIDLDKIKQELIPILKKHKLVKTD